MNKKRNSLYNNSKEDGEGMFHLFLSVPLALARIFGKKAKAGTKVDNTHSGAVCEDEGGNDDLKRTDNCAP